MTYQISAASQETDAHTAKPCALGHVNESLIDADVVRGQAEQEAQKAYRVHLYAVVRVPVDVPSATSQLDAIKKAEAMTDLNIAFKNGEYADDISSVLVDEAADSEYVKSTSYMVDDAGHWKPQVIVQEDAKEAAKRELQLTLKTATDCGLLDDLAGDIHPDVINQFCDAVHAPGEPEKVNHDSQI